MLITNNFDGRVDGMGWWDGGSEIIVMSHFSVFHIIFWNSEMETRYSECHMCNLTVVELEPISFLLLGQYLNQDATPAIIRIRNQLLFPDVFVVFFPHFSCINMLELIIGVKKSQTNPHYNKLLYEHAVCVLGPQLYKNIFFILADVFIQS